VPYITLVSRSKKNYDAKEAYVHTAQVTKISTHWCYLMEIDFAIRHLQSKWCRMAKSISI